ncbi:glycerophosphodiester phosphodiesterase family protein [Spirillospora sp. NPDC052269]
MALLVTAMFVGEHLISNGHSNARSASPAPPLPHHFFIAHRGSGTYLAPENTAAAFEAGIADPHAKLLEFDIRILKDGGAGIWHGPGRGTRGAVRRSRAISSPDRTMLTK